MSHTLPQMSLTQVTGTYYYVIIMQQNKTFCHVTKGNKTKPARELFILHPHYPNIKVCIC